MERLRSTGLPLPFRCPRSPQERGEGWEKPSEYDELKARWKGWLKGDPTTVFREESDYEWTAGDPQVPPVFNEVCKARCSRYV